MKTVRTCRTGVFPHVQRVPGSSVGYYVSILPTSEPEAPTIEDLCYVRIADRLIVAPDCDVPITKATDFIPGLAHEYWRCAADMCIRVQDLSGAQSVAASLLDLHDFDL